MSAVFVTEEQMNSICSRIQTLEEAESAKPEFAELFFSTNDVHPDDGGGTAPNAQPASFVSNTVQGGWSVAGNSASYAGTAGVVKGNINLRAQDTGTSNYWAKPIIRVTETVSGRVFYLEELAMQTNTAYDGTVYFDGSFVHLSPPANPVYVVEYYNMENRTATLTPDAESSIVFEADCIEVANGGGTTTGPVLGQPANGVLVSDNFQDGNGNAPLNLQVRNTTGNPTNWQAVVTGPYATIPNLVPGNYTLQTIDNGDGTYTHVFTGTSQLGGFQNIIITGGLPVPAGSGGTANVDLYIP